MTADGLPGIYQPTGIQNTGGYLPVILLSIFLSVLIPRTSFPAKFPDLSPDF